VITTIKAKSYKDKPKKVGPQKEKVVPISWAIGVADFNSQKKLAIQSVLSRGHKAILQLESKFKSRNRNLTDLELEKRQLLVDKCKSLGDDIGKAYKPPQGNIRSVMTLFYTPKDS
jgi:hypothetical protein